MLSFLREQGYGELPAEKLNAAGKALEDGTEAPREQEYFTVAARGKRTHKSTILLAVLFAIGLVCLWFMIKKSAPQPASAAAAKTEETQIEIAIARLTGIKSEIFSRMDQIVKKFYKFSDVPQVQVNELVKNPFELEVFLASLKKDAGAEEGTSKIDIKMLRQQQMREKAEGMQLLSIMQSQQGNCCMINDEILSEGSWIGEFEVRQIGDSFVRLEWNPEREERRLGTQTDGADIILKLSE